MKALALTSPFSVVYIIHLLKLRRQVSTSVYKQFSTTLAPCFLHLGMQQWKGVLLSQTFPESVSASPKLPPKVFILILGFETHFCFSPSNSSKLFDKQCCYNEHATAQLLLHMF